MSQVTDKQIFDALRVYMKPMAMTQPVVNMVNANMKDPIKRAALVSALGLEQCANPQYNLNATTLKAIYGDVDLSVLPFIHKFAPIFGIVYKKEMAGFLANVLIESNGFRAKRESFNYRAERLLKVFPARIKTLANAKALIANGQPAIANFLYNNRYGNGGGNDGWDYRGGGLIQLTFKGNYMACQARTGLAIGTNPKLIENNEYAAIIAMDYWYNNGCNEACVAIKNNDITAVRKIVNGGTNGIAEVKEIYIKCMKLL